MATHKCNKCLHQAFVKLENGNREFCLTIDYEISETVKNCSEFFNAQGIKEPEDFLEELDELVTKPNATTKRRLNKIKKKITLLRAWGEQELKPKMRR